MAKFKSGDLVVLKEPEQWPMTTKHHGHIWVVVNVHSPVRLTTTKSIATGYVREFYEYRLKGVDDDE